jgi:hypothetical protein
MAFGENIEEDMFLNIKSNLKDMYTSLLSFTKGLYLKNKVVMEY